MSIEKILEKAKKGSTSAEVFSTRRRTLSVSFENNQIKDSSTSDLSGTSVRVIKNGKIGISSSSEPGDESIAEFALDSAEYGKKVKFDFPGGACIEPFKYDTKNFDALTEDIAVSDCENAMNELKSVQDGVLAQSAIMKESGYTRILTSHGLDFTQEFRKVIWICGLTFNTEGNFLNVYDFRTKEQYDGFNSLTKFVKEEFEICRNNETINSGKYRVLLPPRSFMYLMSVFMSCLSGYAVAKGISPWIGKLGEILFDEKISIISDMVSDNSSYRRPLDDEGTPTGKRVLIDKGVLQSFYHSLDTASQCGQEPTGHAFRGSFASIPSPSLNGMVVKPGKSSADEMKKDAEIWVEDLMGAIMSNPYSGVISGNISMGFIMENGKRRARIKDAVLTINIFDLFKNAVLAVSKESDRTGYGIFFPTYDAPWILIDGVSVSAK